MTKAEKAADAMLNMLLTIFASQNWRIVRHYHCHKKGYLGSTHSPTRVIELYPIPRKEKTVPEKVLLHELFHLCHGGHVPANRKRIADDLEMATTRLEDTVYPLLSKKAKGVLKALVEGQADACHNLEHHYE